MQTPMRYHANITFLQVIRGNSVVMLEALERIGGDDRRQHRE
jgi:hypothetical protein